MQCVVNERCKKKPTAATFHRFSAEDGEIWVGCDEAGRFRYGWLVSGTEEEIQVIEELFAQMNDPEVLAGMLPGSMNEAAACRFRQDGCFLEGD